MLLALSGRPQVLLLLGGVRVEVGCGCKSVVTVGCIVVIASILVVSCGVLVVLDTKLLVTFILERLVACERVVVVVVDDGSLLVIVVTSVVIGSCELVLPAGDPSISPLPTAVELHNPCPVKTNTTHKLTIPALAIMNDTKSCVLCTVMQSLFIPADLLIICIKEMDVLC